MGILLSLGNAELTLSGLRDSLAESVVYELLVEENMDSGKACIVRSKTAVVERQSLHALFRHVLLGEDGGELARTVIAEVVEDYCIALLNLCERSAGSISDDDRLYELVSDVSVI